MSNSLKLYSDFNTKRTQFVFELIFEQLLGLKIELTPDLSSAHVAYTNASSSENSITIPVCSQLLNSHGTAPIKVTFCGTGQDTLLFPLETPPNNKWAFDLFAAVFYLVSRYEEYEGFEPDAHGRFQATQSILYQTKSFEYPLINNWVNTLKKELTLRWPEFKFKAPAFRFISTIDIDSTFQYKEKGILWTTKGLIKDLVAGNFEEVTERLKCLVNRQKDAFDVFEDLNTLHQTYNTELIYFFLLGNYSKFDKNISWKNKAQASRILSISKKHKIGIHPSYTSNSKTDQLPIEIDRLSQITGVKPTLSRQHFLVHKYPDTYQKLIKNGIKQDYTLGYTSHFGFRAGIASPFFFYDLSLEQTTDLLLYPFCSMDITPLHYGALNPEQAIAKNAELLNRVKAVGGTFISLWHNESLSGRLRWKGGWPLVYHALIKHANNLTDPQPQP